jgi:biopolymer transport protein ExbD
VNDRLLVDSEKSTLMRALREVMDPDLASPLVVITADALASHQSVVRAMDAAGSVGLIRVSITTQQPEDEE